MRRHTRLLASLALLAAATSLAAQAGKAPTKKVELPEWRKIGLDAGINWIRDPEVFLDGRRPKRRLTLKVDRTKLLNDALAKATQLDRPVIWYVYRVVENKSRGRQMYRAPILDVYMQYALFADPDVVNIINNRFVPLRMVVDEPMAERFNLRPLDFVEPAVVFLNKDGKVIHKVSRFRTFNAHWFHALMRRILKKSGAKPAKEGTPVHTLIAHGRFEEALAAVRKKKSSKLVDMMTEGSLLRRLGKGDDAIGLLMQVVDGRYIGIAQTEVAICMAQMGKFEEAHHQFEAAANATGGDPKSSGRTEYMQAVCLLNLGHKLGKVTKAMDLFQLVAAKYPKSTWGRKAKVAFMEGKDERPMGPVFHGFESIEYMPKAAYEGLPSDTAWAGDPAKPKDLIVRAVKFLLRQQRSEGGFVDSRYAYWGTPKITPNAWVAITALAAQALAKSRERVKSSVDLKFLDEAIAKARAYALDPKRLNRGQNEDVYADCYRLMFLADESRRVSADAKKKTVAAMNKIITDAGARQKAAGFWAHEYANAFCTQAMLWSLREARQAGATVPEEMISKGLTALQSARHKSGAYVYGGAARPKGRSSSLKDASARMPSCEGTLFAFQRSDKQKLEFAFETFWKHMDRIEKVRRNDFHSDGELAGFFFFHALYHASEANKLLSDELQVANKKKFLEILLRVPEMDGSFVDSHEIGRSYGTAMALLIFANILD